MLSMPGASPPTAGGVGVGLGLATGLLLAPVKKLTVGLVSLAGVAGGVNR
jgi:hypothetical protein